MKTNQELKLGFTTSALDLGVKEALKLSCDGGQMITAVRLMTAVRLIQIERIPTIPSTIPLWE
jgi:hypothetical protein